MITKCHSKKTVQATNAHHKNAFSEKILYLNEDRSFFEEDLKYIDRERKEYVVLHNLKTQENDIRAIGEEFLKNFSQFHAKRKNTTVLEHFKISLSPENFQEVLKSPSILQDLVLQWLNLYAPDCLGYAKLHFDKAHPHAHILISGNLLGSRKQNRKSKAEFQSLQWKFEQYKRQKYPSLEQRDFYKMGYHRKQEMKRSNAEQEMTQRQGRKGKPSRRDEIKENLEKIFQDSFISSKPEFITKLAENGLKFFERGKVSVGVIDTLRTSKNKHRFRTLGMGEEWKQTQERWDMIKNRELEFEAVKQEKVRRQFKGVQRVVTEVLNIADTVRDKAFFDTMKRKRERGKGRGLSR